MVRVGVLVLFLTLESFQSFTIKYDVCHGVFVGALYQVEEIPLYSSFIECFYHENTLDFVLCLIDIGY